MDNPSDPHSGDAEPRRRFPSYVYGVGEEPDARFSLANERTFLAWVRTALALYATGVAVEAIAEPVQPQLRLAAALVFLSLGLLATTSAWFSWMKSERALRLHSALPGPRTAGVFAIGLGLAATLLLVGLAV